MRQTEVLAVLYYRQYSTLHAPPPPARYDTVGCCGTPKPLLGRTPPSPAQSTTGSSCDPPRCTRRTQGAHASAALRWPCTALGPIQGGAGWLHRDLCPRVYLVTIVFSTAFQCLLHGLCEWRAMASTALAMSGLVFVVTHSKTPTACLNDQLSAVSFSAVGPGNASSPS